MLLDLRKALIFQVGMMRDAGYTVHEMKAAGYDCQRIYDAGYDAQEISTIVEAVRTCSWSRGLHPTNPIGTALQDADRLDAIGAIGIARTFATAQAMSSRGQTGRFYDPEDPLATHERPLNDRKQPVDHFYAKLLKLSAGMHTEMAKHEAEIRHRRMVEFLHNLAEEI